MPSENLEKAYVPALVEESVYQFWEKAKSFHACETSNRAPFSIVIPPPNVTGMLTLGHVLNNTLQDILIRFYRMNGRETLWLPGTDHAGIATQNVVEKALTKEKLTRHDLGREKFVERVWEWKEKFGGIIIKQLKKLGCSCDWERERFTMDEGLSNSVQEAFIRLYEKGLIYKGKYIINWCPRCQTALSDEEKIPIETNGNLWYIRYPFKNGKGHLVVATTRPETMLGDTAVAVNPDDDRFREIVGETLVLPLVNREIPVISDDFVDPKFGTGIVKVTPAHDPNDFEIGRRHNLPRVVVMDERAVMNQQAGKYNGLDRYECRKVVLEDLERLGLLEKTQDHVLAVGHCERCDSIIEPYLSDQWFVKMKSLAKPAIEAVKTGKLRFTPERWVGVYLNWMNNIRDWCISRQLWWGHRIPAFNCSHCENVMVTRTSPQKCDKCGGNQIKQENDVLDTWFSSWLWPFSTMGWPENSLCLRKFYPTDTLITGPDIIFFWVARMVMAGYEFVGQSPFHDVYFTSIVRDIKGRKMSKSLGNSPDPLELIQTYGADALRFTIIFLAPIGQDIRFSSEQVEMGRNFANKLWNASRFVLMNRGDDFNPVDFKDKPLVRSIWSQWILSRLSNAIDQVRTFLADGQYKFNEALKTIYNFIWDEFCDWYIEMSKPGLFGGVLSQREEFQTTLYYVLDASLRLLHPFMPFVTEEIWQKLQKVSGQSKVSDAQLMLSQYPEVNSNFVNLPLESEVADVQEAVRVIRNLRATGNISPQKKLQIKVVSTGNQCDLIMLHEKMIKTLANIETLEASPVKLEGHLVGLFKETEICLNLEGFIDVQGEIARVSQEKLKIEKERQKINARLNDQNFVSRAPNEVVERVKEDNRAYDLQLEKLSEHLVTLQKILENR